MLRHILNVLSESHATYRSKAIKAVATVISSDPSVLGNVSSKFLALIIMVFCIKELVQTAVKKRILDQSISVREATVDLIGKHLLDRPEFITHYYEMILDRILVGLLLISQAMIFLLGSRCQC